MSVSTGTDRYRSRHPAPNEDHQDDVSRPDPRSRRDSFKSTTKDSGASDRAKLRRLQQRAVHGVLSDDEARELHQFAMQYVDEMERLRTGSQL